MKTRVFSTPSILLKGSLLAVLLAACASQAVPVSQPQPNAPLIIALTTTMIPPSPTLEAATQASVPTEAPAATLLPVATSRGPNLEATDPTTVRLDSGGLQFVEFFRFT